ncbi:MAG TPA: cytochrome c [Fimbriimonadaceae bacterium]|nr:cytochrome c [Fimbriimonadaceae bacterium]HRJ33547.1 cytochrome c [Fimbriimonadaceae bacterium]
MKSPKPGWIVLLSLTAVVAGCHTDMWVQPKQKPLEESTFYRDRMATRPPVEGTVARGHLKNDTELVKGYTEAGQPVERIPESAIESFQREGMTRTQAVSAMVKRGQERYNIFCSHCHGQLGDGKGMIAQRGFTLRRPPANFHEARLLKMPDGHFYDAITNGFGTMLPQASRVEIPDRWAVVAYIRAIQLSGNASLDEVPAESRGSIAPPEEAKPAEEKR